MTDIVSPPAIDLLIVGGGINGAGLARDAAGRGLSVLLVEQDDLAGHTSSASTKLIHGGLRYLEYGEFRLVREALIERERLWRMAPHIISPLSFVLPQTHSPRPAWMVRLGLFLYDHLGGRKALPATRTVRLDLSSLGEGLADRRGKGFVYADCQVDDARLVILNAVDAAEHGARILTRTHFLDARRDGSGWTARVKSRSGIETVRTTAIVNAAGPWVSEVAGRIEAALPKGKVRLVKGSHIVVPKLTPGDQAYMLQNPDRRIVFAIPYEGAFTLVGTTDVPWEGPPPEKTKISEDETTYLLDTVNRYFTRKATRSDILWSYAGIRPLFDDRASNASAVTRDYVLDLDRGADGMAAALLSIFGGKITTYRKLAEQALSDLAPLFPHMGPAWTAGACLPGGDMPAGDFDAFLTGLRAALPDMPPPLLERLAHAHGTRLFALLSNAKRIEDMGEDLGGGVTEAEVDYLATHEWAHTAEDILFRRGKSGLHVPAGTADRITARLAMTGASA
ncbi:MAG: glycerol-3-phosphate dehydrogenase [Sphingomonadales bacterium]|nr:MAG: glycerol-3-phosphate dehydrogenase [Sphingomonadales bacterium]TNF02540.1 MAG: glycerol-3-phosphate dehydrogenase [Sphingomonadales bacterium]